MTELDTLIRAKEALMHSGGTPWGQSVHFTTEEFHAVMLLVREAIRKEEAQKAEPPAG